MNHQFRCVMSLLLLLFWSLPEARPDDRRQHLLREVTLDRVEQWLPFHPDSALRVLKQLEGEGGYQKLVPRLKFMQGEAFRWKREDAGALRLYRQVLEFRGTSIVFRAEVQNAMGKVFWQSNIPDSTLLMLHAAVVSASKGVSPEVLSRTANDLGDWFMESNKPDSAIRYFLVALGQVRKTGDQAREAFIMNNIGLALYRMGDLDKSVQWQLDALRLKELLGDGKSLCGSLLNVGMIMLKLDKLPEARTYLLKGYKLSTDSVFQRYTAPLALNLGVLMKQLRQYDSAEFFYNQALLVSRQLKLSSTIGKTLTNMGALYEVQGKLPEALAKFTEALEMAQQSGNKLEMALRSRNIAGINLALNRPAAARPFIFKAAALASELHSHELNMDVYLTLARYYEQTGQFKEAYFNHKKYKQSYDSLYSIETRKTIDELNTRYQTEKKEQEIANLQNQQRIRELELVNTSEQLSRQRIILWGVTATALLLALTSWLFFNRYRLKQRAAREQLARQKSETEQRLLLMQMNPHFIFNSLASIQQFIGDNEAVVAQQFLGRFSRLMRLILENSSRPFVPLADETELLEHYLNLEKLRFGNRFCFSIENDIDEPEFVMIPPMITQPFVENAVLHGFRDKHEGGVLTLKYIQEGNMIRCTVSDNGCGRSLVSGKPGHRSLATSVVMQRLNLLRTECRCNASLVITDLFDSLGQPAGTKVELLLPFREKES